MNEQELYDWVRRELTENILPFWQKYGRDRDSGDFYGSLDNDNVGDPRESRSIVMTSRHLWAYSAAFRLLNDTGYLEMADYAYHSIMKDFLDKEYGGVLWSVKSDGSPDVTKKQIYGQAFAMYALAEYACVRKNSEALDTSLSIYALLETHARDKAYGGYAEARSRSWKPTQDLKLSEKDIDCAKSMNTNLHVMEALTCLHRSLKVLTPENTSICAQVAESLSSLVVVTTQKILGKDAHLDLYFNDDWTVIGDIISYGHDIESSWLLWEAVEELGDHSLENRIRPFVVRIAEISLLEGFDPKTGGFDNEFHAGHKDCRRVWWCQAEALVGFYNAFQMTGERRYLDAAIVMCLWIEKFQKDHKKGDWFSSVSPEGIPDFREAKGGNWKTSYHNGRCCMELITRISNKGRKCL